VAICLLRTLSGDTLEEIERAEIQSEIDALTGEPTEYGIYAPMVASEDSLKP